MLRKCDYAEIVVLDGSREKNNIDRLLEVPDMRTVHKASVILSFSILFFLSGCAYVGPRSVPQDRFAYTDAISESWKQQMLLNMVKIRYADAPVFLDVSSVINQYLLETEISGQLAWNAFLPEPSQNIGARGRFADRPTITYQPLQGEKFTRGLLTPIPPDAIMSLAEAGWRIDYLFRLAVQSVNGNYNRIGHQMTQTDASPEFFRLIDTMRKIQTSGAVGMRMQPGTEEKSTNVIFFRRQGVSDEVIADQETVCKILGVNPELNQYKIVYGALARDDTEIAILSRSMLQILSELSSYIEIPQSHIDENRAMGNFAAAADVKAGVVPMMHVHSSAEPPRDAFASVQYRNHWVWIDDKDVESKRVFSFLMYLLTLAEPGAPHAAPVLTIPAG